MGSGIQEESFSLQKILFMIVYKKCKKRGSHMNQLSLQKLNRDDDF
jgi:hypothetical protein